MNDIKVIDSDNVIDLHRRQTLKGFTCISAISLLASMQSLAAEPMFTGKADVQDDRSTGDIEATLISSPDVVEDTLLLRNLTRQELTISHFHADKLVFDGIIVDCSGACARTAITIPAGQEVAVQVMRLERNYASSGESSGASSGAGEYLDVHSSVSQLPGGTKIVPMVVHMIGNAAVLSQAA